MDQNPPQRQAMISGRDRISELPDAIICEILSNLLTKDAVATTILSKRWKGQWTYCFNLDFSNTCCVKYIDLKFVKAVIALNKSPCIKKFRLRTNWMYKSDVTACLEIISCRNVEAIELDSSSEYKTGHCLPFVFPQWLFTCQTLVFLDIDSNAIYDIPPSVHMPSLKVFRVTFFNPSDAVTTKLFCGLPVLEDLSLSFIGLMSYKMTLNIFTPSLKRLKLKLKKYDVYDYWIVIRAPSLEELDIYDNLFANYMFEELSLDVKATLKFRLCTKLLRDENFARAIQLMNGISGVKSLALSSCILRTLDFDDVVVFPNITCLEVDVTGCCGFIYLPCLIERVPNLEFLVLEMVPSDKERGPLGHESQCLLLHLKRIEVRGFEGQEYELKLLGYLLKVAQVLDDVVIYTRSIALEERKKLSQKLSLFPSGSKNCQFKILEIFFEEKK